jgi:hypothetical protein
MATMENKFKHGKFKHHGFGGKHGVFGGKHQFGGGGGMDFLANTSSRSGSDMLCRGQVGLSQNSPNIGINEV